MSRLHWFTCLFAIGLFAGCGDKTKTTPTGGPAPGGGPTQSRGPNNGQLFALMAEGGQTSQFIAEVVVDGDKKKITAILLEEDTGPANPMITPKTMMLFSRAPAQPRKYKEVSTEAGEVTIEIKGEMGATITLKGEKEGEPNARFSATAADEIEMLLKEDAAATLKVEIGKKPHTADISGVKPSGA